LLGAAWAQPLFARTVAGATDVPLGTIARLALYVLKLPRAWRDRQDLALRNRKLARM
jgi:hypothetical protein